MNLANAYAILGIAVEDQDLEMSRKVSKLLLYTELDAIKRVQKKTVNLMDRVSYSNHSQVAKACFETAIDHLEECIKQLKCVEPLGGTHEA